MLHLSEAGEEEETDGWCIYCHQITTWLVTTLGNNALRFECTRCCKISRDLHMAP